MTDQSNDQPEPQEPEASRTEATDPDAPGTGADETPAAQTLSVESTETASSAAVVADQPDHADRIVRGVLIVLGIAAISRGAKLVLVDMGPQQWISIAIWLAAGSAVHDLVIAPTSVLLGRVLRRPLRIPMAGNAVRGVWLGLGTILLVGVPLLGGARHRSNPTVIPGRPGLNVGLSLALLLAGGVLVIAVSRVLDRRRRQPPARRPTPTPAP